MLDKRRPYGGVVGDNRIGARYYQDGHYYGPDGSYICSAKGKSPPAGEKYRSYEDALAGRDTPAPPPNADADKLAQTLSRDSNQKPTTALPETLTREQRLAQMSYFQLASLVKAAGGEPAKGSGAKQKMITFLLENTSE